MTFQAAVGTLGGWSAACCAAQSMVWPGFDLAHLHRNLVAIDGVVVKERERELPALAGPQDARRSARGHGQDLGGLDVVVRVVRGAEGDAGVGGRDVQQRGDDVVVGRVGVGDDDGAGPSGADVLRRAEDHVQ